MNEHDGHPRKKLDLDLIAVQLMSTRGLSGAETTSDMHQHAMRIAALRISISL